MASSSWSGPTGPESEHPTQIPSGATTIGPVHGPDPSQPGAPPTWPIGGAERMSTGRSEVGTAPAVARGTIVADVFVVQGRLGAGGMGVVYRALHRKLERPVALKLHAAGDADAARLEREARAMARLSHPNVIGVYDVGTWRSPEGHDHVFIAMELCDAGTLRGLLARRPDWRHALDVCRQAGEGLAAAHAAGLVHRDFKPDNVLLSTDGRVRVADFGLARALGTGDAEGAETGASLQALHGPPDQLTRTGAVIGTPAYMAPEQFGGGTVDARADQFAFAVVVHEALWGARPWDGRSAGELLFRITTQGPRRPTLGPVPPAVWDVLARALDPDPSKRFDSMRTLLRALERARGARGPSTAALAVAIAVPVALVVTGLGVWWWSTTKAPPTRGVVIISGDDEADPDADDEAPDDGAAPGRSVALQALDSPSRPPPPADDDDDDDAPDPSDDDDDVDALHEVAQAGAFDDPLTMLDAIERAHAEGASDLAIGLALTQGLMPDHADVPGTPTDDDPAQAPLWDTASTLECGYGDHFLVEGKTATVTEGPAFRIAYGCRLEIRDCTITAPALIEGNNATVSIDDVTVTATDRVLDIQHVELTVRGLESTRKVGGIAMHTNSVRGTITDAVLRGDVGLQADYGTRLKFVGGELEGDTMSIDARTNTEIEVAGTKVRGRIKRGGGGKVVESAKTAAE